MLTLGHQQACWHSLNRIFHYTLFIIHQREVTINDLQDEIIEEFEGFDDWMDRYAYIIELGNAMPKLDEKYKTSDNLIDGCQSRVWLLADYNDGIITYQADSDALIVKGIVFWMPTSTSSSALACASICRPPAATDCWPWSSMPEPMR